MSESLRDIKFEGPYADWHDPVDRPDVPATNAVGIDPDSDWSKDAYRSDTTPPPECPYCGLFHRVEQCYLVRAIDYYPTGQIRRVELAR